MNDFDDEATISPELAAAIDAGVYQAFAEAAPRMIALIRKLRAAGATWADIELRIATWPHIAGEGDMRLWLDSALRNMARREQDAGDQG